MGNTLTLNPELIARLDTLAESPTNHFTKVYRLLKTDHGELSDYDLICFCIIYLTGIGHREKYFEYHARELNKALYFAHYNELIDKFRIELMEPRI